MRVGSMWIAIISQGLGTIHCCNNLGVHGHDPQILSPLNPPSEARPERCVGRQAQLEGKGDL